MKLSRSAVIALCATAVVAAIAAMAYVGYLTVSNSGDKAVKAMNAEELARLKLLATLRPDMTREEVYRTLGAPSEDLYFYSKWNGFGGSFLSQARVYFADEHPMEIRWLKAGHFVYEKKLYEKKS